MNLFKNFLTAISYLNIARRIICNMIVWIFRRRPFLSWFVVCFVLVTMCVFISPFLPGISSSKGIVFYPHNDTIKLVSYGLGCGYTRSCRERLNNFVTGATDYDILLLQELYMIHLGPVYLKGNIDFMNSELYKQGYLYRTTYQKTMRYLFLSQNNGLASFSRFPIRSSNSTVFSCTNMWEYPSSKGFEILHIPLRAPNTSTDNEIFVLEERKQKEYREMALFVFNVHLGSHRSQTRTCQLQELLGLILKLPTDSYIVVSGYFNIDPLNGDLNEYWALKKIMGYTGLVEVYDRNDVTYRDGSHYDHAFVSKNIEVLYHDVRNLKTPLGEPVSDHFGLFMSLKLLE